jgi:hypothetical protein
VVALREAPWFNGSARIARAALPIAITAYLVYALSQMGLAHIWQSIPTSPAFYVLLVLSYFVNPASEALVYRLLWGENRPRLGFFLRKRVINSALVSYSGEVYLFLWARQQLGIPDNLIWHSIKDSIVLSGAAAVLVIFALLGGLTLSGEARIPLISSEDNWLFFSVAGVPLMISLGFIFARRRFTVLPANQIWAVFAIHIGRNVAGHAALVLLWALALPSISLAAWLNLLAIRLLVSHVYILPNRNLFVLAAEISTLDLIGLPGASVAAVLLTITAGYQVMHTITMGFLPVKTALFQAKASSVAS